MIVDREEETLAPCLQQLEASDFSEMRTLGKILKANEVTVCGALIYPWSHGQVEEQIHRLKMLKRQT